MKLDKSLQGVLCAAAVSALLLIMLPAAPQMAQIVTANAQSPTPTPITLTISGQATSGTAGVALTPGLPITLHLLRTLQPNTLPVNISQRQTTLDAQGGYRFEAVTIAPGDLVFVSVSYAGIQQSSVIVELPSEARSFELPLVLYAPTADPGAIALIRARHILSFEERGIIQVLSSYFFRNTGDRFFLTNDMTAAGQPISVRLPLPVGARGIAFDPDLARSVVVGGSQVLPVVQDTRPLMPGLTHELVFSYQIPYEGGASIDQDYFYNTEAVEILIPADANVKLESGEREFGISITTALNPGRPYTQYVLKAPLRAGERLVYTLTGGGSAPLNAPDSTSNDPNAPSVVAIFLFALTVVGLAVLGVATLRRSIRRGRGGR